VCDKREQEPACGGRDGASPQLARQSLLPLEAILLLEAPHHCTNPLVQHGRSLPGGLDD